MRASKIKILFALSLLIMASCNKQLSPLLNDPSNPTPAAADVDLYLNNLQLNFKSFYIDASDIADQVVRQETMFGPTYFNAYGPTSFDDMWNKAYQSVFLTANTMVPLAEAKSEFTHAGIAQVLKAYTMITMVDFYGDVPYSEADLGVGNTNPKVDKGADIYTAAIALLDSAIANFAKTSSVAPANDLFYGGSGTKWTTLAKTLKLKAYVQTRLVDNTAPAKVAALLSDGDLITTSAQDFVFSFSTHNSAPDSRAPHYTTNYGTDNGTGDYLGNYFMWCLRDEKTMHDPRTPYYIYRQIDDVTNTNDPRVPNQTTLQFALACFYRTSPYPAGTPYCIIDNSYWGRDHGNNEGTGPDNLLKSTWGVYPAAGEFDANQNKSVGQSTGRIKGAGGNGILPIWLASYTYFLRAEAALMMGTGEDPKGMMTSGIEASMSKVAAFPAAIGYTLPTTDTSFLITSYKKQKYESLVQNLYDNATSDGDRLNVIEKEFYLATWGNGIEPYNTYRRTSKPDNFQTCLYGNQGDFIQSFFYASVYVNYNKNATQKSVTSVKVFWDTNPDVLK